MIRMLTPAVSHIRRALAVATPTPDPLLDPQAGVVHGDGPIPADYLEHAPAATIHTEPGSDDPFLTPRRPRRLPAAKHPPRRAALGVLAAALKPKRGWLR